MRKCSAGAGQVALELVHGNKLRTVGACAWVNPRYSTPLAYWPLRVHYFCYLNILKQHIITYINKFLTCVLPTSIFVSKLMYNNTYSRLFTWYKNVLQYHILTNLFFICFLHFCQMRKFGLNGPIRNIITRAVLTQARSALGTSNFPTLHPRSVIYCLAREMKREKKSRSQSYREK